jgi:phosphopantothenoylcysteine decarboxylase/phosphopantothenate--cysteine ligase
MVIHAAAVGDFSIASVEEGRKPFAFDRLHKLESNGEVTIKLKKNFKIVDRIKGYAMQKSSDVLLVAFKLTVCELEEEQARAVNTLFAHSHADYVVHNDLQDFKLRGKHPYHVYSPVEKIETCPTAHRLAEGLENLVQSKFSRRQK